MQIFIDTLVITGAILIQLIKTTWWIIIPVVVLVKIKPVLLLRQRMKYAESLEWTILEIRLPYDVQKTPKAMENVLAGLHGVWSNITSRDKWTKGKIKDMFSLEMVGTEGSLQFFVRCQKAQRNLVESKIFAQYPDAEILEVRDYTEELPSALPNKDFDTWGAEYELSEKWAYPLATYEEFEDTEEERRMDPISQYAELVAKLEEGEHMWMQLAITPVLAEVAGEAKKERNSIIGKKEPESTSAVKEISDFFRDIFIGLFGGEIPERPQAKPAEPGQPTQLTEYQKELVKKIERKENKLKFHTTLRTVYIGRSDVFQGTNIASLQGVLRQFSGDNTLRPVGDSAPKNNLIFFKKQRNFIRKRRTVIAYRGRFIGFIGAPMVLSTEELATMFHFPGRVVRAPFMPRIPSRTSEPPRDLPR